ncbi:MAG: acyl-CoA dehydrogenase family protein, partial [Desulfarculaceae bacterium]
MSEKAIPLGGEFLLQVADPDSCFTPEELSEEHLMILKTTTDFVNNEVLPHLEKIHAKDEAFIRVLFEKAGELGLLGTDVPEEFGGLGLDKISTCVVTEAMGNAASFAVSQGAHTGIGTLPIVYYGNKEQKAKYLPGLAQGTSIGAYCLTESGAGSDAVGGCRAKAVLSDDGKHYILNGEKIFITNGGWADTFIVFAKIDGTEFSAFIIERAFPGVSVGAEEKKLGIQGSSTTSVIMEDAQIPVENLLYERGKGHHIALNILNIGRYKLGAATVGGCKGGFKVAVEYAKQRLQFGQPISDFGMIREKLARMAIRLYLNESINYRTVGLINASLEGVDMNADDYAEKASNAIREYAVECAMCK